jgi:hypothetical protein
MSVNARVVLLVEDDMTIHDGYIRINEKVDYHIQNFDEPLYTMYQRKVRLSHY